MKKESLKRCDWDDKTRMLFPDYSGGSGAKILVGNLPAHVRIEDVEQLLSSYGQIQNFEKAPMRDPSTQAFLVSYETPDQAQQ